MKRLLASVLLLAAAPGLSGCVALAVPIATGVLVSQTEGKKGKEERRVAAALDDEEALGAGEPVRAAARGLPAPGDAPLGEETTEDRAELTTMADLPAPGSAEANGLPGNDYAEFFAAATAIAQRDPFSEEKRYSALLANAVELSAERTECAFAQTAVLVDIDPGEGEAPLGDNVTASDRLIRVLTTLRAQEVAVLWLSRHTAARAGAVRRALLRSGLDPEGRDELYLVRYEDETKATRRADAAKDYCIVAILGDEKRDFDELFGFLKDPKDAYALDSLIGKAWFLAPPPLISPSQPEQG